MPAVTECQLLFDFTLVHYYGTVILGAPFAASVIFLSTRVLSYLLRFSPPLLPPSDPFDNVDLPIRIIFVSWRCLLSPRVLSSNV